MRFAQKSTLPALLLVVFAIINSLTPASTFSVQVPTPVSAENAVVNLQIEDHTQIVQATIRNGRQLREILGTNRRPSGADVLQALLRLDQIDEPMKAKIREALRVTSLIEKQSPQIPARTKRAMDEILASLEKDETVSQKIATLKRIRASRKYAQDEGLANAIELLIKILEDGSETIYAPSFYKRLLGTESRRGGKTPERIAKEVLKADAKGAATGALTGCVAGAAGGTAVLPGGGTVTGCIGVGAAVGLGTAIGSSTAQAFIELFW